MTVLFGLADRSVSFAEYVSAKGFLVEAIDTIRSLFPGREREVLLSEALVRLGNVHRLAGDFGEALGSLAEARMRIDAARLEPVRRAGACNALGILAKDVGDLDAAERWYAEALSILEQVWGPESPRLASLQHNLAGLAYVRADFVTAEMHARRALDSRGRIHANPDELAGDLCVLGASLAGQGRHDEAEAVLLDALDRWAARYGPSHYEVAVVLHNLGAIYFARGDRAAAAAAYTRSLEIKRGVLGDQHREVAVLVQKLAAL